MKYLTKIVLAATLMLTVSAYAQDEEEAVVLGWTGTGELGFVNTTGNTKTVALNGKLNFVLQRERWRHRFSGTALATSEDGIKDNERYTMEIQSDRILSEKSWLFGAFRWDADKFGSYDPQASLTAGYGRQLMKSEKHELKGEIGAGYKNLEELGVEFIEQPLHPEDWDGMRLLKSECVLPLIADESCQRFEDVEKCSEGFHGINIKLMKCGGLTPALKMIEKARELNLKVMAGCMAESTVGISNLAQIAPLLDYLDADGALLLKNDTAKGVALQFGKIVYPEEKGSGISLL